MQDKNKIQNSNSYILQKTTFVLILLALIASLSLILAFFSTGFVSLHGWTAFFWVSLLSIGIVLLFWQLLKAENPPGWLLYLVLAAALLRLAVGVFWTVSLPVRGHGTPAELNGYVMGDAAGRDQAAWKLASSNQSLWDSFQGNRKVDQYGGLLFISAWVYRFLGSDYHQPLLMVLLGAACSALAVLFSWAFANRLWGSAVAALTAWVMFLYPEAVLLGSSQMREAYTIPLVAAAFYGLARYRDERSSTDLVWVLTPFLFTLFLSPPTAALLMGGLVMAALVMVRFGSSSIFQHRWIWIILIILILVGLGGLWLVLRENTPDRITNPIAMISWWLRKSAALQGYISQHASGWMQKIFKSTPEWTHLPMLLAYGIVQPFLPAALVAGSEAPVWHWIAIWRSVGWTLLLAFLAFAPFHTFRKNGDRSLVRMLTLIIWLVILLAAFRGGSDMWDNPRYRAIFSSLQIALAAKIIVEEIRLGDPWLRRALLLAGSILAWFLPWYLYRYYGLGWPITDPFRNLALGVFSGLMLIIADWAHSASVPGKIEEKDPISIELPPDGRDST
jgi:hypothetical protein